MLGILAFLLGIVFPIDRAFAATDVSGTLSGTNTWTIAGSPYRLVDNLTLAGGATLEVGPGVSVESTGPYRLNIQGEFGAVGTAADPIHISLQEGLHFYSTSGGSQISWAEVSGSDDEAIGTESGGVWPSVHHVLFRNNGTAASISPSASASVTDSRFIDNDWAISTFGSTSFSFDRVLIEGSYFNDVSIGGNPSSWTMTESNILPPTTSTVCGSLVTSGCTVSTWLTTNPGTSISAQGLWWGTTDSTEINRRIRDGNDDPSLATVSKDPVVTEPYDLYPPTSSPDDGNAGSGYVPPSTSGFTGIAADDPSAETGISSVDASIKRLSDGKWWDGDSWVDSESFLPTTGAESWEIAAPPLADGLSYQVRSLATDDNSNKQWGASSVTLTVDGTPPALSIDSGPEGLTNNTSPSFAFTAEAGANVECSIDTGSPSFGACSGVSSHSPASPLTDGPYTFRVRATDAAANQTVQTRTFTVDNTPPNTTTTSGPTGTTNDSSPSFGFTSNEAGSTFECRLDSGSWGGCTNPKFYSSLADDLHTFEVRAIDAASNADPTPATRSFTVDTTAPKTKITKQPKAKIKTKKKAVKAQVSFSSEPSAKFKCKLDKASFKPCTSPYKVKAKSKPGEGKKHTISIQATDQAGNVGEAEAVKFKVIRKR